MLLRTNHPKTINEVLRTYNDAFQKVGNIKGIEQIKDLKQHLKAFKGHWGVSVEKYFDSPHCSPGDAYRYVAEVARMSGFNELAVYLHKKAAHKKI